MLRLELKKMLKTPANLIIIGAAVIFSFILSYLPVTYESCMILENGQPVLLKGYAALAQLREIHGNVTGEVTPELLAEGLNEYNTVLEEYHVSSPEDLPDGVYSSRIGPYYRLLHMLREAYADPKTGIPKGLEELTEEDLKQFETVRFNRLNTLMEQENRPEPVRKEAAKMYQSTRTPLQCYPYFSSNVLDYELLVLFMVMVCGVILAAPVFSLDYQTGADDIQRCTKNGMTKLALVKCASVLIIVSVLYVFSAAVFFLIFRRFYGTIALNSDIQTCLSLFVFEPWTIGQFMKYIAIAGYICTVSTVLFTMMLSASIHTSAKAIGISMLALLMPMLLDTFFGSGITDWIITLLPSCGLMIQCSFYYAVHSLSFLSVGTIAVATERAMTLFEMIGIPVYFLLTLRIYKKLSI